MNTELHNELAEILTPHQEAFNFLKAFGKLCHALDDIIDRDVIGVTDYTELTLDAFGLAADVYSCDFYRKNATWLYPLVKNKHRIYSAGLAWEKSAVAWQATYADVLRCGGDSSMMLAVLEHVCRLNPVDLRRIDNLIREDGWAEHHNSEGKPT